MNHTEVFMAGMPGGSEMLLVLFVILLLFGAKKLPELSRALGKSLGEFKKGKEDIEKEIRKIQTEVHQEMTKPDPVPEKQAATEDGVKSPSHDA